MSLTKHQQSLPADTTEPISQHAPDAGISDDVLAARGEVARLRREQRLDDELAQSFPASDPPSWVLGITPTPR